MNKMAEIFWLPVCLLVVCAAVPLDRHGEIPLAEQNDFPELPTADENDIPDVKDGRQRPHSRHKIKHSRNRLFEMLQLYLQNDTVSGEVEEDRRLAQKINKRSERNPNIKNNASVNEEAIRNLTMSGDVTRDTNVWMFSTFQLLKQQKVSFHSRSFLTDLRRHISGHEELSYFRNASGEQSIVETRNRYVSAQSAPHKSTTTGKQPQQQYPNQHPQQARKMTKGEGTPAENVTVAPGAAAAEHGAENMTSCEHVTGYNSVRWMHLVVGCPSAWPADDVRIQCEAWNDLAMMSLDAFPFLPVQDDRGAIYANVFCAKCHGVGTILPWTTRFVCDNFPQNERLALLNLSNTTSLKEYLVAPHCKREVVPSVPETIVSCRSYGQQAGVRKTGSSSYDVASFDYPVSFNVLMNFDFTGDTHLLFSAGPKILEEYIPRCREWETFDTYSQTCRPITCNKFYTLVGDRCVPTGHDSTPTDSIVDLQQLHSIEQTALVSLVLNITYGDYLLIRFQNMSVNVERQIADKLNISMDRIKDVNVTFDFGSTNATSLKVTTLTEEQYKQIFPPLIDEPNAPTNKPNTDSYSTGTVKARQKYEHGSHPSPCVTRPGETTHGVKSDKKNSSHKTSRLAEHDSIDWSQVDIDQIISDLSEQASNGDARVQERSHPDRSGEMDDAQRQLSLLANTLFKRKALRKYMGDVKKDDVWDVQYKPVKSVLKQKTKSSNSTLTAFFVKGSETFLITQNGTNFLYISEPVNNRNDRIILQAQDLAATAAFMTGVEILEALINQSLTMRVTFVLVPPHDPHSNEDGTNTVLQKINTLIVEKRFSLKVNGNNVDVIDADDKTEVVADARDFCTWGVEYMVYDDEFTMTTVDNVTLMYINKTNSYIGVGRFDLYIMVSGSQKANQTNVTDMSKYAFVCFMPRISQRDCSRIDLESNEYYIAGSNRSIVFEEREYDVFSYRVANESTGRVQICVPLSFNNNMQTLLPHVTRYGGCSHDFDTALRVEGYMTMVLGRVSMFALACVLVTYCLFSKLRNLPGVNTMNLTFALLTAEIIFSEGILVETPWLCSAVAMSLHFSFLAAHFWMNVMSYDVFRTFAHVSILPNVREKRRYLPRYAAYAWGVPFVIVGLCAFIDFSDLFDNVSIGYGKEEYGNVNISDYDYLVTPDGEVEIKDIRNTTGDVNIKGVVPSICWITKPLATLVAFGAPVMVIFLTNCIFFARTILSISRTMKVTKKSITVRHSNSSFQKMTGRSDVMLYVKMSTVMGFTWIFGISSSILSSFAKPITYPMCIVSHALAICFTLFNASQGLLIFIAFVCNRRVLTLYKDLLKRARQIALKKSTSSTLSLVSTIESSSAKYILGSRGKQVV
ncbi:unnamed protein product [Lymnaea stagnalis]|uniref:G-protein coupled receptors family 2 profile 2 domain-containing protein n=1 Tax=Lymnaea stagnalis TaxID=6523 RepID=A0AAV2HC11_LYMST